MFINYFIYILLHVPTVESEASKLRSCSDVGVFNQSCQSFKEMVLYNVSFFTIGDVRRVAILILLITGI
jgi:hypothetical protein